MTPDRWQQIEEIFQSALDLAPPERAKYINTTCKSDPELKKEVEKLLSQFDESSDFIEKPLFQESGAVALADMLESGELDSMIGDTLGNYRIEREIGRGGMGAVYEAVRADGSFRMRAAIKLVKRGMDTDFILKRFRNERQILATLEHPYITRLIDGGTTPDGRPYFVMDYIDGRPLYDYCDKSKLGIKDRLRIFIRICDAVEYAHQKMVIHRDLKPSNILVSNDGTPRLLDFGIAKLLDPEMSADTLQPTATAMRMMTVDYASPEQVRGETVTYSTDIYSLGVILYELLTGHRPYHFKSRMIEHAAKVIAEEIPQRPSEMVLSAENILPRKGKHPDGEPPTLIMIGHNRGSSIEEVSKQLAGDLDRIVLKTLRKDTAERYASMKEFRDDVVNHLEGRPVMAREFADADARTQPDGRPFVRDDNSIAVLPFKVLGALSGGDTGDDYLGVGLADTLITRLSQMKRFTVRPTSSVLRYKEESTDPFSAGETLGVRYVLDGTIRQLKESLRFSVQLLDMTNESTIWAEQFNSATNDVLELEDLISERVSNSLVPQIKDDQPQESPRRSTNNPKAYEAFLRGRYFWNQFTPDSLPKAKASFEKATEIDPNYALAHVGLADFYIWGCIYGLIPTRSALMEAEKHAKRAIEIDELLGEAYATLGLIAQNRKNWDESEKLLRKSISLRPNYVQSHEWLAALLVGTGIADEGVREMLIADRLDILSPRTKTLTAWTLYQAHRFEEAIETASQLIDLDQNYPQSQIQMGASYWALGRYDEALTCFRNLDNMMPDSALAKYLFCFGLVSAGEKSEAESVLQDIERLANESFVKPYFRGMAHAALGKYDEAFEFFEEALSEDDPWMLWFGTEPMLKELRNDPRYTDILRRMNNPILDRLSEFDSKKAKSLAVLPFQYHASNTDETTDSRFLGVGITDALVTRLSGIKSLAVRPTTSVMKYSTGDTDSQEVGVELGVDYVLEGNIRQIGDRIRFSAQLLDVKKGGTHWAETFDDTFTDILALEDSISDKVANSLIPELTGEEKQKLSKRGTKNAAAYEAYLRGRAFWLTSTPEGLAKALVSYNEATALDPDFAAPYAGIADYHNFLSVLGIMAPKDSFPAAKENAEKALSLDPGLAEAYVALAVTAMGYDWDFAESERLLKKALELNQNYVDAHFWYSNLLTIIGQSDRAISEIERAHRLSPKSPPLLVSHILSLKNARRFEEGIAKVREAVEAHPNHYLVLQTFSWLAKWIGNYEEAVTQCMRAVEITNRQNTPLYCYGFALAVAGKHDEAREILSELKECRQQTYVPPIYFALIHTALGENDEAFEWLEKSVKEHDFWTPWTAVDPRFDSLHDDPRYFDLLKRIGHPLANKKRLASETGAIFADTDPGLDKTPTASVEMRPGFLQRHRWKSGFAGGFAVLMLIAYATGFLTVQFKSDGFTINTNESKLPNPPEAPPPRIENSIVILPFKSTDPQYSDIGIGLADALTTKLGSVKRLTVLSANTGRAVANDPTEMIGPQLGVQYILRSDIRKTDTTYFITSELLTAPEGAQLWKAEIETKQEELFTALNKLGDRILQSAKVEPLPVEKTQFEKTHTLNGFAYQLYLIGRSQLVNRSPEDIRRAIATFTKAAEADPGFALAYVGLADAYNMRGLYEIPSPPDSYPKAIENAKKALDIDPELASAHVSLGYASFFHLRDRTTAELEFRRAIQINPSYAQAHSWFSSVLIAKNRMDEAVSEAETAKRLDPRALTNGAGLAYFYSKQFDKSVAEVSKALAINPNFTPAVKVMRWNYSSQGNYQRAREAYMKERLTNPEGNDDEWYMIEAQVEALNPNNKAQVLEKLNSSVEVKSVRDNPNAYAYEIALAYNALGEKEEAFEWLEKAEAAKSYGFNFLEVDHRLDNLRGDPRFQKLLQKLTTPDK